MAPRTAYRVFEGQENALLASDFFHDGVAEIRRIDLRRKQIKLLVECPNVEVLVRKQRRFASHWFIVKFSETLRCECRFGSVLQSGRLVAVAAPRRFESQRMRHIWLYAIRRRVPMALESLGVTSFRIYFFPDVVLTLDYRRCEIFAKDEATLGVMQRKSVSYPQPGLPTDDVTRFPLPDPPVRREPPRRARRPMRRGAPEGPAGSLP